MKLGARPRRGTQWVTQDQLDRLAVLFEKGLNANQAAMRVDCSRNTAEKNFRKLRRGEALVARSTHAPRPRFEPRSKVIVNREARFYHSDFIPS